MHRFDDLSEVHSALQRLRDATPACKTATAAASSYDRFEQLFSAPAHSPEIIGEGGIGDRGRRMTARLITTDREIGRVAELQQEIADLRQELCAENGSRMKAVRAACSTSGNIRQPRPGSRKVLAWRRCFGFGRFPFHPARGAVAVQACPHRSRPVRAVAPAERDFRGTRRGSRFCLSRISSCTSRKASRIVPAGRCAIR